MDEHQILSQMTTLVDQEHALRTKLRDGELSANEERDRLAQLEGALDQRLDLLLAPGQAGIRPEPGGRTGLAG